MNNQFLTMLLLLFVGYLPNPAKADSASLKGFWQQDCSGKNLRSEEFSETYVTYREIYFSDSTCTAPILEFVSGGNYLTDHATIDFQFQHVGAIVHTAELANSFNERQVCGLKIWQAHKEINIDQLSCDFFNLGRNFAAPKIGSWKYGIWKVEDQELYLGKLSPTYDGSTPQRRPIELNPRSYKRKFQNQ